MTPSILEREISFADAKTHLSALTTQANATGTSFVITKNHKPWVEVRPLAVSPQSEGDISITPIRREVVIPDLDALFSNFDANEFTPTEDGFANAVGGEVM